METRQYGSWQVEAWKCQSVWRESWLHNKHQEDSRKHKQPLKWIEMMEEIRNNFCSLQLAYCRRSWLSRMTSWSATQNCLLMQSEATWHGKFRMACFAMFFPHRCIFKGKVKLTKGSPQEWDAQRVQIYSWAGGNIGNKDPRSGKRAEVLVLHMCGVSSFRTLRGIHPKEPGANSMEVGGLDI